MKFQSSIKAKWSLTDARDNITRLFDHAASDRCLVRGYNKITSTCPLSRNKLGFVRHRRRWWHPLCATFIHTENGETNGGANDGLSRTVCCCRHRCQIGIPNRRWQKIEGNAIGRGINRVRPNVISASIIERRQQINRGS